MRTKCNAGRTDRYCINEEETMKLLFKQRLFSWFDSYDIYYENGEIAYTVEGKPSWGHKLHILDNAGRHIATVKQAVLTFMPKFELYLNGEYVGCMKKKINLFTPRYEIDFNGWCITGSITEWDYDIVCGGCVIATIGKKLFNVTDTYLIETKRDEDALLALMTVLAIDAEKCSRNNG